MTPEKLNLSNTTVKSLREQGIRVRVNHFRRINAIENGKVINAILPKREIFRLKKEKIPYVVSPNEGCTTIEVNYNGREYIGKSVCSTTDGFSYSRGRVVALGRLELVNPAI